VIILAFVCSGLVVWSIWFAMFRGCIFGHSWVYSWAGKLRWCATCHREERKKDDGTWEGWGDA
jgi:hypothetical protein